MADGGLAQAVAQLAAGRISGQVPNFGEFGYPTFEKCMHPGRSAALLAVVGLLGLVVGAGCSPRGATVTGKVTLDGAPLDDANISFVPEADAQKQAGWATIAGGQYSIPESSGLGTGEFRVEIRALRPTGEKSSDPTMIPSKEIIPTKYNTQSQLSAEIKPGENVKDFELKSK